MSSARASDGLLSRNAETAAATKNLLMTDKTLGVPRPYQAPPPQLPGPTSTATTAASPASPASRETTATS